MAIWRASVSTVSVVILTCISRINCIGYRSSESLTLGFDEDKKHIEYDPNPRIQVRHGDSIINDTLTANGRFGNIDVVVYAFNEIFVLNLRLNRKLFASSYVEKIITKTGSIYNSLDHTEKNCYYIGRVQDRDDSVAAVSTCTGIVGQFVIAKFSYHVETQRNSFNKPLEVYRIRSQFPYGSGPEGNNFRKRSHFTSDKIRRKRSFMWPQDRDGQDKVLELYLASDHSQFVDKGSDSNAVFQRAKNIANFASSLYQPLDIYYVLVGMEVWTDGDKITISSSEVDTTLQSWYSYRMQKINPYLYNDIAVLITRVEFSGQVIGKSIIGAMCSNEFSGSIIVDKSNSASAAGSTMAHEIGHSFGLQHDNSSCYCADPISNCIMYPSASAIPATDWSSCSIQQFSDSFKAGTDICLYDVPQTIYDQTVSTCGNGIIENGEQCDCGRSPQGECNSTCCNSITCQLTGSATCASGRCCDTARCRILAFGSLCRSSIGDCDLPEYCDGSLSTCPTDTYKPDGTKCTINGDSVYCYSGECRSHRSQCELIWGEGINSSSSICYLRYNIYGLHYGNCGLKWLPAITYIACQPKNALCGKLLCVTTNQHLAYYQTYFLFSLATIDNLTCNSVIFDFGLRIQDPGLVPNGAYCGAGQMCMNQNCVNVSSLQIPCLETCHGDQVCNNLGHCQNQSIDDSQMPNGGEYPGHGSSSSILLVSVYLVYTPIVAIITQILY